MNANEPTELKMRTEWRWVDEKDRAMTEWKEGEPPAVTWVEDEKGVMRVQVRVTDHGWKIR